MATVEPWPLPTEAPLRILAWPRYQADGSDLRVLALVLGSLGWPKVPQCICLRFDPTCDGDLGRAVALIETTLGPIIPGRDDLELIVVDEVIGGDDLPRLGQSVSCALQLTTDDPARDAFADRLGVPLVRDASELRELLGGEGLRRFDVQTPGGAERETHVHDRAAVMLHWLKRAYAHDSPYFPPVRLDISLTEACNIKCGYCWQQKKERGDLTFDVLASAVDDVAAIRPPSMVFTGGEATIWPDFLRLVSYSRSVGVAQMKLVTNGLRLAEMSFAEDCVRAGISSFNLSVDTFNPENFERLRTFPYAQFKAGLDNVLELRRRNPRLEITLASVLHSQITPEELHEVRQFCRDNNLQYFMQTFFDTSYAGTNRHFALSPEARTDFQNKLQWLDGHVGDVVLREENPFTEAVTSDCYKGVTTVKIHHNGDVSFCWTSRRIGNLFRDGTLLDIWTSEQAREMRAFIRGRNCVDCNFDCDIFESLDMPDKAARLRVIQ